jgi:hypothetical protein
LHGMDLWLEWFATFFLCGCSICTRVSQMRWNLFHGFFVIRRLIYLLSTKSQYDWLALAWANKKIFNNVRCKTWWRRLCNMWIGKKLESIFVDVIWNFRDVNLKIEWAVVLSLANLCKSNEIWTLMLNASPNKGVWEKSELTDWFEIFLWMLSENIRQIGGCEILAILQSKVTMKWLTSEQVKNEWKAKWKCVWKKWSDRRIWNMFVNVV